MKRIVSLLIVFTMILSAFTMTGCGEKAQDEKGKEALNVGIVVSSKFGDKSFNDSAKDGVDKLKEDYGVAVTLIECKGDNFKQNLTKATEKADIIVAVGWEFVEIGEIAADYPDKKFIWVDNVVNKIEEFPNVMCITYAQNEGAFVAGYIAAKTSNTGVVGVVGGENRSTINDFIVAYEQGAEYADPNVDVKKIYTNDYEDPAKGRESAMTLNERGADVVFQVAGNAGQGVFAAAKEKGFYAIGVDQDQKITAKEFDSQIICSMLKDIGGSIYDVISAFIEDESWAGGTVKRLDMSDGYVSIGYGNDDSVQQVSDAVKAEANEITNKIISGEIAVNTAMQ